MQRIEERKTDSTIFSINSYFPILLSNHLPSQTSHHFIHRFLLLAFETCNNSTIHPKSALSYYVRMAFAKIDSLILIAFCRIRICEFCTSHFYNANHPKWSRRRKMDGFSKRIRDKTKTGIKRWSGSKYLKRKRRRNSLETIWICVWLCTICATANWPKWIRLCI